MAKRACFILIWIIVSVAVKANQILTGKAIVREKLLPIQTLKSSSGRQLEIDCRKTCYPGDSHTCHLRCECDINYDADSEIYFCEPYDSGICSPCNTGYGPMCPGGSGCGCQLIEGTSIYGCLPNQQDE